MAAITHLPDDVIIIILEKKSINLEDIVNFKSTCKRFQQIILPNKFWERKYYESCFTAKKRCSKEKQKKIFGRINFKEKIEAGLYYIQKFQYYALMMSENKLRDTDKEQLEHLLRSTAENSMTYYFVLDEMNKISAQQSCKLFSNLTIEYNFKLIFHYLKQYRFVYEQMKFMNMPKTRRILEKQLTIVAQHFQPHVSYSTVQMWLDEVTKAVLSRLKNRHSAHSICSTDLKQFFFWKKNNIDDNFWNEVESKQIMCVLEEYIFAELDIHELSQLLMKSDLEAEYIKDFTECFRDHLLTAMYHIVARRLGIRGILGLHGRDNIAVLWNSKYNTNNWDNTEYFYMNQSSNLLYPSNIIRKRYTDNFFFNNSLNDIWITREMMKNFYQKLKHNSNIQWDFSIIFNFLSECLEYDVECICIENEYKNITYHTIEIMNESNAMKKRSKRRPKKIKFAVGMIVSIKYYDYCDYEGVIIGWDHDCRRIEFLSKMEINIMCPYLGECNRYYSCECEQFSASAHQPHFIILLENNSIYYVPQDKLLRIPPKMINNIEIGRYFTRFEGTCYIPNGNLRKHYAKDSAIIAEIFAKQ